ncbi:MAG: MnmC family methyltransferase [Spirochaetota bacterium]|nr:MnmC family methyltransferase [Spirochaetota bacterium]
MTNYSYIVTGDGSVTLYSDEFSEHYHSITGAYQEALYKFALASNIFQMAKLHPVKVLDICFGLGYNSFVTIEHSKNTYPIEIHAIEKDESVIQKAISLNYPHKHWNKHLNELYTHRYSAFKDANIKLHIGDARTILQNINEYFNVIYLDPFSTKKNTELWTYDFFKLLKSKTLSNGVLVTYSSALPVRSGLLKSYNYIYESDPIGRRRGGTIASIEHLPDKKPISEQDYYLLTHSDGKIPYRDPKLNSTSSLILARRDKIVKYLLKKGRIIKVKKCFKHMKINKIS